MIWLKDACFQIIPVFWTVLLNCLVVFVLFLLFIYVDWNLNLNYVYKFIDGSKSYQWIIDISDW